MDVTGYVKAEVIARLAARPDLAGAVIRREPPTAPGHLGAGGPGRRVMLAIYPDGPGDLDAEQAEVGAGYLWTDLTGSLDFYVRAEGATATVTTALVDDALAGAVRAFQAVLAADPTLGKAPGSDDTIPNLVCRFDGWDQDPYQVLDPGRWVGGGTVRVSVQAVARHQLNP